ncbi:MAG: aminotransferase class III-fold pyridoxal phosphate-dependent enzyme [Planctomycetaceae bacterium]|jgi:acetylornithine/succinyldiaminopimelate/putrescine aminotransferase/predicted amino acid dehydrogenase|nr:aminotransferase class III-fold pyridoxal phosphate-dependent enzyme [Planctomycetaceae bacterium]MBT6157103.1 aminotransferase class III-fold pyridoxal phosphate-dependent enzyme [Planctomycetaceae bacterium]MBT6484220.1 aminotransferase class III-fold pyridoxal phosphate-dependent enzyme [Planctomycetaceae bacterium]MBT6494307.1 aminotransferase class III-fold pyridoxal phosphate-dependent enzyme [Planctomycetaceae bacterium]
MERDRRTHSDRDGVAEYHKPGLRNLLRTIGLDIDYEGAAGDFLYYRDGDSREVEVLDLVGGYGTLLLGHNNPKLIAEAARFFASGRPNHTQGSIRSGAERLAEMLSVRAGGDYCAVFGNSGAEAVEAALKHSLLETGGRTIIVLEGGFHGKTSGALRLTANRQFREPFEVGGLDVIRVQPNDAEQLRAAFAQTDDLAGFLFEPIQGEAGVRPLSSEFIQEAAGLCGDRGVPLIADECQTGLGRIGEFLASHAFGVTPDYIILSKALGGGLAKVSALLVKRERYQNAFDLLHSSTFADDEFSCALAMKTLELLNSSTIQACRSKGEYLLRRLRALARQYPGAIADVRGAGLLIGIELRRPSERSGFLLNFLAERDLLGPLVSGYLLRERQIRIAPTLSDSFTLRVQPSALISCEQLDGFVDALADVCERLQENDVAGLTRFLSRSKGAAGEVLRLPTKNASVVAFHPQKFRRRERSQQAKVTSPFRRVAWVFHMIDANDLVHLEPECGELTLPERDAFLERFAPLAEPVVMDAVDVRSSAGETVRLYPIVLPVTSAWLLRGARGEGNCAPRRLIQDAVDTAATLNCDVVSLGQFTSTVTRSGRSLRNRGLHVSSGNNYTAALVEQSIRSALDERGLDSRELTLAVVGAAGDVGRTSATMLAPAFRRSILVGSGRAGSQRRIERLAKRIPGSEPATDLSDISSADVVVCATNSIEAPLGPEQLHPRAIVCDVSVPPTVQSHTTEILPDVTVVPGAVARLPMGEDLGIPGLPLPPGYAYGCMAEGLLLGLDGIPAQARVGRSSPGQALKMLEIAARHGFAHANNDIHVGLRETYHVSVD